MTGRAGQLLLNAPLRTARKRCTHSNLPQNSTNLLTWGIPPNAPIPGHAPMPGWHVRTIRPNHVGFAQPTMHANRNSVGGKSARQCMLMRGTCVGEINCV